MNKFLVSSVTALLLAGSVSALASAGAYTDPESGFKVKTQPSWMQICGKSFYGLASKKKKKDSSLNLVCAFTAKEVQEATGKRITTEEIRKMYKDLQVQERNSHSPDKVK